MSLWESFYSFLQLVENINQKIFMFLAFFGFASVAIGEHFFSSNPYYSNVCLSMGAGLSGSLITYVVIEVNGGLEKEKRHLIFELGSNDNQVAKRAAFDLYRKGLLQTDILVGADLAEADLTDIKLSRVNLHRATLGGAKLVHADLSGANLTGAYLKYADLTGANLAGAFFERALLGGLTLPDGTKIKQQEDLLRFTQWEHPSFWRSNDPVSPAYEADNEQYLSASTRI